MTTQPAVQWEVHLLDFIRAAILFLLVQRETEHSTEIAVANEALQEMERELDE